MSVCLLLLACGCGKCGSKDAVICQKLPTSDKPTSTSAPSGMTATTAPAPDSIDRLVSRLSSLHGLWQNGLAPAIELPPTATAQEVVSKVLAGQVTSYKIVKIRSVRIPDSLPELHTAVIVETNDGEKIVLFRYEGQAFGWWSRIYDTKTFLK